MGKNTPSRDAYMGISDTATKGGKQGATSSAEERVRRGEGLDPLVDPKGPPHLGPIRRSLPRFEKEGNFWVLTRGVPMSEETLLDTTGSMGNNVDIAFKVFPFSYDMYTTGRNPVLARYDPQIATAIFGDVEDNIQENKPVLCRSQFEMDEKIVIQMTRMVPSRLGFGNGKEDPQFGLFGAAYLTKARINDYGLKYYHSTVTDEPVVETVDLRWLKKIFGEDVLERIEENGYSFTARDLPNTAGVIRDLQTKAHAFIFMVGFRPDVKRQWMDLYGADHFVMLPGGGTDYIHHVKALIIGLTEGVLDLTNSKDFLREHGVSDVDASLIVRSVAHIPLGAQMLCENFDRLPKAGDLFREKTDLWPIDPSEAALETEEESEEGPSWL